MNEKGNRYSVRAFKKETVPDTIINEVLEQVRWTASSKNTQPWKLHIIRGDSLEELRKLSLKKATVEEWDPVFESTSPKALPAELYDRAKVCGFTLFEHKGIGRDDWEARKAHNLENYKFFDAPLVILFSTIKEPNHEVWVDMGQLLANTMEQFRIRGIASCPQWSLHHLAKTFNTWLKTDEKYTFSFGLSLGYEENDAHINKFRTVRQEVNEFTTWYD
tara:strand:+ start:53 stop:709 length:657 start_codon:yes stop_codon:yes gene_type:complete